MGLDARSPIPLHAQLKEKLKSEIGNGGYTDRIPSERELMELFAVSRTTVREAVAALVRDGFLEKIHGKGTFVTFHAVNEWLGTIRSFTETVQSMGMKPGIRFLRQGTERDPRICTILGVLEYHAIERLRFADDAPVAIERTHYPVEIGRKIATRDLNKVTIYSVLEAEGILLTTAEQKISATMPTKDEAKLLRISPKTGVLAAERVTTDSEGRIIEYYSSVFRPDKYAFCVRMHRKQATF